MRTSGILEVIIDMLCDPQETNKNTKLYAINNIALSRRNIELYDWVA